jgi:outer membrane receptor protein involved in Fe transport
VRHRLTALLSSAMGVAAFQADAQYAPDQTPPPAAAAPAKASPAKTAPTKPAKPGGGKTVDAITVTGASQSGYRSSIDRRSYGVANDLATTTGSISDALKNVPSVEVDVQGNVSLRGDSNVTIMVDGKPSALFRGATAAQALQAMPADSIERVEVITNPSAAFSPEGAAGIINLVTKTTRKPGGSGSVRLNVGTSGRYNGGATAAYSSKKLTVTGDIGGRHDQQNQSGVDQRTSLDGQGNVLQTSTSQQNGQGHFDQWNARTGLDYDLTDKTRLSGEVRYNHFNFSAMVTEPFVAVAPGGVPSLMFNQVTPFSQARSNGAAQASVRHKFGDDHELVINISWERTDETREQAVQQTTSVPAAPDFFADLHSQNSFTLTEAKADYTRPMAGEAKLKTGYDLRIDQNDYDNVGLRGTRAINAQPDPTQTNLFLYKQTINAAYATYERPFGNWTVLGGLRLEEVQLDLSQKTTGEVHDTADFKVYPSLHLAYKITDDQQLILSYSKRVQRPNPGDLNPFRVESDPLNFHAGNPNLQPQLTDSFEAGYQYKAGQTFYLATLYYRRNEHGVTDVITDLGNGVLLNTRENLTNSQAAGLELVANGHLTKTLSYNASTNLYWNEIDATGQGLDQLPDFSGRRQAFAIGGRGNLNWQITAKDTFQVSAQANARQLLPQGFSEPQIATFLGYRHKFNDSFSAVVTAQDPFKTLRFARTLTSPTLRDHISGRPEIQALFVGLTWNLGTVGKKPRDTGFDFGNGPGPTP